MISWSSQGLTETAKLECIWQQRRAVEEKKDLIDGEYNMEISPGKKLFVLWGKKTFKLCNIHYFCCQELLIKLDTHENKMQ